MLERMELFFEARLAGYDEHMLAEIEGAGEFYRFTAELLPRSPGSEVLDLGCGTELELERQYFAELERLKREQGIPGDAFYHYDTPLTAEHESRILRGAGFSTVDALKSWGATATLRASR